MDLAWQTPYSSGDTYQMGPYTCVCNGVGFAAKGALVVRFTTPAVASTSGVGSLEIVEFEGPVVARTGAVSTTPCDFTMGLGQAGASGVFSGDTDPSIYFTLGYPSSSYVELMPSTTYYVNVENTYNGSATCTTSATCDVKVALTPPKGS
jgi:hypothetical protein